MAKLNAVESDLLEARRLVASLFDGETPGSVRALFESSEMGMRSFRILSGMRPLIVSVWTSMCSDGDPNRFTVGNMLNDIDSVLGYWVVPDEKEEDNSNEK